MMRSSTWLAIILFAFGASASVAKPPKAMKRKPAAEAYEMRVHIAYGERTTDFLVTSSGHDGVLRIYKRGIDRKKKLDRSEIELLLRAYNELPAVTEFSDDCYRTNMEILMVRPAQPQAVKASCFAIESPTEPAFRHFANLLAQPF